MGGLIRWKGPGRAAARTAVWRSLTHGQLADSRKISRAALSQGPPGCVLEGKAQPLGPSGGKGSLQAERPGPGHQVLGDEDQLQPGGVGGEALGLAVEGSITR